MQVLAGASDQSRVHHHRFVWFDKAGALRGVSRPFFFQKKGIEFAAGIAWHPDGKRLLISYGVAHSEAWIATVDARRDTISLGRYKRIAFGGVPAAGGERVNASVVATLPMGRSFDLFDTLVARRCVYAHEIFERVERLSGHAGFARARRAAEADISSAPYGLDHIYRRLDEHHGILPDEADQLKRLELEMEAANLFPIREHCGESVRTMSSSPTDICRPNGSWGS